MIPTFPDFKSLKMSDKAQIEEVVRTYPPYSDFNFTSMWSWNVHGEIKISMLNNNLIIKLPDYTTSVPGYTFIGESNVDDTAEKLIKLSESEGLEVFLKLIPEMTASKIDGKKFIVEEDLDNFDYIYMLDKLGVYDGNRLRSKRNLSNRFIRKYVGDCT